jgi:hypothetical protein
MALRYRFPHWCQETIGSTRAGEVRKWFLERGLDIARQLWSKFLDPGGPPTIRIATWIEICQAAQQPLSTFIDYLPSEREPKPRLTTRSARKPRKSKSVSQMRQQPALPPRPSEFFASRDG